MAAIFLNRKLFQYYRFSDPSCPNFDDCYFFSDDPPRVPASPPPLSAPVPKVLQFSSLAIVIVVVLASVCLLVSCSAFILKCCTSWTRCFTRRSGSNSSDPSVPTQRERDNLFGENDDQADQTVNHPIWLISTVGLQQSVINTIAIVKYKKEDGLIEGTDCSVCLGEFEEEETLRVLPKCNHAFHIECIDPWLRSHTNCPLCRASIVPTPAPVETPPRVTRSNDSDSIVVELGGIQTEDSSENRGNSGDYEGEIVVNPNVVNEMDDGPLISERRSYSVQIYRDPSSNRFRLMGSASSSRVRRSPCSRFSPMTGPIKRSYSWGVRVIGSSDNPICNSRFSP